MDCTTLHAAKNELAERLTELGKKLDTATDKDQMRALLRQRKIDMAAMAAMRALTHAANANA